MTVIFILISVALIIGIPLLRLPVSHGYTIEELRIKLDKLIRLQSQSATVTAPPMIITPLARPIPAGTTVQQPEPGVMTCPKCTAAMVKRQAVNGKNAGKIFWACTTYPKCRQVAEVGAGQVLSGMNVHEWQGKPGGPGNNKLFW